MSIMAAMMLVQIAPDPPSAIESLRATQSYTVEVTEAQLNYIMGSVLLLGIVLAGRRSPQRSR